MLSPEALLERRKGIGGSDAPKIVSGEWFDLWQDKTGRKEPDDLSGVWPVQLGIVTETLNLDWYARSLGVPVQRRGEVVIAPQPAAFLRCTLDGWDDERKAVIQGKHCSGRQPISVIRERYAPQVMHEMIVTGARSGILSVIMAANEPVYELFERDEFWEVDYVEKCRQFWHHVETDTPPTQGAPMSIVPAAPPAVMRVVDMTGSNTWAANAATWLRFKDEAKAWDKATKELKTLVEADVREAKGHGILISRSKAGALTIKEAK